MDTPVGRATKASQWQYPYPPDPTDEQRATVVVSRLGFKEGAAWSRTDALHDPTDTEMLDALNASYSIRFPKAQDAPALDYFGDTEVDAMRAVLSSFLTGRRAEG